MYKMEINQGSGLNINIDELVSRNRFQDSLQNDVSPVLQEAYNFVDSPWHNGINKARNVELGGLSVESEKILNTSKIEKEDKNVDLIDQISNHMAVMAERTVVFHMFWGVVKKTQTEFKNMARGQ